MKGKKVRHCLAQFQSQKRYADTVKKKHILYAPDIHAPTKRDYEKNGIIIKCSMKELTKTIKEYEK